MLLYITTNKRDAYDAYGLWEVTYALLYHISMGHHSLINNLLLFFLSPRLR